MIECNEVRDLAWNRLGIETYKKQYASLIKRLKKAAPTASCLGVSPTDVESNGGRTNTTRREIYDVIEAQKTVSIAHGCAYFNIFEAMGGSGSLAKLNEMGMLLADYVHPKGKGGDILGEIFARSLLEDYSNTPLPGRYTLHSEQDSDKGTEEVITKPKKAPKQLKKGGQLDAFIRQLLDLKKAKHRKSCHWTDRGDLIAAQIFTDQLRQRLAERFGNRGRGYISVGPFSRRLFKTGVVRHLEGDAELIDGRQLLFGGAVSPAGQRTRMKPGALFEVTFCAGCSEPMVLPQTTLELAWLKTPDMGVADLYLDGEPLLSVHKNLVSANDTDIHFTKVRASGLEHTLSVLVRDDEDFLLRNQGVAERRSFLRRGSKGPLHLLSVTAEIEQPGVVLDALGLPQMGPENLGRWRKDLLEQQIRRRAYDLLVVGWNRYPTRQEHKDINNYKKAYLQSLSMLQDMQPNANDPSRQSCQIQTRTCILGQTTTLQGICISMPNPNAFYQSTCSLCSFGRTQAYRTTAPRHCHAGPRKSGSKRLNNKHVLTFRLEPLPNTPRAQRHQRPWDMQPNATCRPRQSCVAGKKKAGPFQPDQVRRWEK